MIDARLAREMQGVYGRRAIIMAVLAEAADDVEEAMRFHAASEECRKIAARWGRIALGEERLRVEWGSEEPER